MTLQTNAVAMMALEHRNYDVTETTPTWHCQIMCVWTHPGKQFWLEYLLKATKLDYRHSHSRMSM